MPANAKLTPWPQGDKGLPEWDSLSFEDKKLFIKQADIYGAYLAYADHEIGRVIQEVEDLGELDNTLIIYIGGDNGASAEGMLNGTPNEFTTFNGIAVPVKDQFLWYPFWGSDRTFPHYAAEWAWAMDTPFKWVKQVASHFGGTAQGMVMSWPATSVTRAASAVSSTISLTSCRRFSKRPASRRPTRLTVSSRSPLKA
jgi:arylsulfatase A-like enzyme